MTDMVSFRAAAARDLRTIVWLLADDPIGRGRENPGPQLETCYRDAFAAIERDPNQLLAVAERSGDVIGVLQLSFIPGLTRRGMWRGQIEGARVAASERASGIGRAMLEMGYRGVPQARLRSRPADLGQASFRRARLLRGPWL